MLIYTIRKDRKHRQDTLKMFKHDLVQVKSIWRDRLGVHLKQCVGELTVHYINHYFTYDHLKASKMKQRLSCGT